MNKFLCSSRTFSKFILEVLSQDTNNFEEYEIGLHKALLYYDKIEIPVVSNGNFLISIHPKKLKCLHIILINLEDQPILMAVKNGKLCLMQCIVS